MLFRPSWRSWTYTRLGGALASEISAVTQSDLNICFNSDYLCAALNIGKRRSSATSRSSISIPSSKERGKSASITLEVYLTTKGQMRSGMPLSPAEQRRNYFPFAPQDLKLGLWSSKLWKLRRLLCNIFWWIGGLGRSKIPLCSGDWILRVL
jgi:hypothetical protein